MRAKRSLNHKYNFHLRRKGIKHVGVPFTSFIKPNGYLYKAYSATFMVDGKQFKRHFSIKKYGKAKALELAKQVRKQGTIKT